MEKIELGKEAKEQMAMIMLMDLVDCGLLTAPEADLARRIYRKKMMLQAERIADKTSPLEVGA
ncbi:MAG: hypothetical protein IJU50_09740 [Lachnospiraceae bacterium]|nr:hypothetical protein [Lachnospiraceae bacterium]